MAGRSTKAGRDCPRCPRLVAFRQTWREREPAWFNAPVPSFGPLDARLLIVGPGARAARRQPHRPAVHRRLCRRPALRARSRNSASPAANSRPAPDDSLELVDARITNAVRCVPPENKPTPAEINTCRDFLTPTIARNAAAARHRRARPHRPRNRGQGARRQARRRRHSATARARRSARSRCSRSYHCSRYNTNTGVLTPEMFRAVFAKVRAHLRCLDAS